VSATLDAAAVTSPGERGIGAAARHGGIVAGRNVVLLTRNPSVIAGTVAFPLIFFFGFYAVLRRSPESQGLDDAQYLPPIVVVQAMFLTAIASAFQLADDRFQGILERCRSLPISPWAPLAGRVAADWCGRWSPWTSSWPRASPSASASRPGWRRPSASS
jgi:hypothetical protein